MKTRHHRLHYGSVLGSLECWLLIRSLKTLHLRVRRQAKNALKLARYLKKHKMVDKVSNPGLISSPDHALWKKMVDQSHKFGAPCFTFLLKSLKEDVHISYLQKFPVKFKLLKNATSLGGVASSLDWRKRWDGSRSSFEYRISCGVEDIDDLIKDFVQALDKYEDDMKEKE